MNYLIYGSNDYAIKTAIDQLIEKHYILKNDINNYDLNQIPLKDIIDDALLIPLFNDKKLIIVDNANIFTTNSNKTDGMPLEDYLENSNSTTYLIFIVRNEKIDERKKITKIFREKNEVIECNKVDINKLVTQMFDGYDISPSTLKAFINRVGDDLFNLKNEAEKLKTFKINDKKIENNDILFATKNIEDNIFDLIDYIINKDTEKALELYNQMLLRNTEPIAILVILANQIRLLFQVKSLYYKNNTEKDIANTLEVHPYRIKLALEKSRNYDSTILLNYLEMLANLDYNIKSGTSEADIALELFILGL